MAKGNNNSRKGGDKDPKIVPGDVVAKEIIDSEIDDQMRKSYLAYAMSVIVGRALPDVRDGLKPVHRRILHAMNERAWRHDRAYVKSAKIVGEVIGNFHPHGDVAVYDTMVRMAQAFAMRELLIDGQGNFGSVDGDPPAAYRYTEARLTKMADALLQDIEKETVNYSPNFDDTRKEPVVLPAAYPNLLVNGSSGIAVGMATKIPPHNLGEVISAVEFLIENPDASIKQLMKYIPAPDFPTGGIIIGKEGIKNAYTTGRGSIKIRAVATVEEAMRGREAIIVTEIPYEIKKNDLIAKIADLVNDKKIEGISEIRDESDRTGMRIVFYLKKDANAQIILNQLYKSSQMEINYGIILLALDKGQPRVLNLKEILQCYIEHRREVITRRTQFDLRKAEERAHILEGLKIALDFIDEVIKIIRSSQTVDIARESLIKRFKLSELQANAILEMKLQKLTSLESKKIIEELQQLRKTITELKDLLSSKVKIDGVVKTEMGEIKSSFGNKRRSEVSIQDLASTTLDMEDLIADDSQVITLTESGYIRRVPLDTFKRQSRGGKGVISGGKKEDNLTVVHECTNLSTVLMFSNRGKVFYLKAYEIPEASKDSRGKHIKALLSLAAEEKITAIRSIPEFNEELFLILLTRKGIIKKMSLDQIKNAKKGGVMAMNFKNPDEEWLVGVAVVQNKDDVFMATGQGLGLRTNISKMRAQGRSASGIIGMTLEKDDYIIGLDVISDKDSELFMVTQNGIGKRVKYKEFTAKGRGGKGMMICKITEKTGPVVAFKTVTDKSEAIITTESGMTIRVALNEVSLQGRSASGVKVVNIKDNDRTVDVTTFDIEK